MNITTGNSSSDSNGTNSSASIVSLNLIQKITLPYYPSDYIDDNNSPFYDKLSIMEEGTGDRSKKMSHVNLITPLSSNKITIISIISKGGDHFVQI
jgi:hypothetical protein